MDKNRSRIIIGILILLLIVSWNKCSEKTKQVVSLVKTHEVDVKYYKNKLSTETASKETLTLLNSDLKSVILKKDDSLRKLTNEFSKLKSIVVIKTETKIDSIPVPFDVSVPCDFKRMGNYFEKGLTFDWNVNQHGFDLENILIPNKTTIITGFKREWFLGRQTLTTDVTNSNNLIKTTNVQTIQIRVPKRFYDTRVFNIGVGIVAGALLSK